MAFSQMASATIVWFRRMTTLRIVRKTKILLIPRYVRKRPKSFALLFLFLWTGAFLVGYGWYTDAVNSWEKSVLEEAKRLLSSEEGPMAVLSRIEENVDHFVALGPNYNHETEGRLKDAVETEEEYNTIFLETFSVDSPNPSAQPMPMARYPTEPPLLPEKEITLPTPGGLESAVLHISRPPMLSATAPILQGKGQVGQIRGLFPMIKNVGWHPASMLMAWGLFGAPLLVAALCLTGGSLIAFLKNLPEKTPPPPESDEPKPPETPLLESDEPLPMIKGGYRCIRRLKVGGMAELWLAEKVGAKYSQKLALKQISRRLMEDDDFEDHIQRFHREANLAHMLEHPNIVRTQDFQELENEGPIIVMEYVRGLNLADIQERLEKPNEAEQAVYFLLQIANGLDYAHTKKDDKTGRNLGIVHRDVSPQNILVSMEGEVKISDFGVARIEFDSQKTLPGTFLGKLNYAAPEQLSGEKVDHRSDIFSLGIIGHELLTGRQLFNFKSLKEALAWWFIEKRTISPVRDLAPEVPTELERIIMKALEKEKRHRFQSTGEMLEALGELRRCLSYMYGRADLVKFMRKIW